MLVRVAICPIEVVDFRKSQRECEEITWERGDYLDSFDRIGETFGQPQLVINGVVF